MTLRDLDRSTLRCNGQFDPNAELTLEQSTRTNGRKLAGYTLGVEGLEREFSRRNIFDIGLHNENDAVRAGPRSYNPKAVPAEALLKPSNMFRLDSFRARLVTSGNRQR